MTTIHISWIDTIKHEVHPIIKIGTTGDGQYYAATPKVRGYPSFCIGPHSYDKVLEEIENINVFYNRYKEKIKDCSLSSAVE